MRGALLAVALFLSAAVVEAGSGTLEVALLDTAGLRCEEASLEASGSGNVEDPALEGRLERSLDQPLEGNSPVTLKLPTGIWEVSLRSHTCWSPAERVEIQPGHRPRIELPVRAVGEVSARLELPAGVGRPDWIRMAFQNESQSLQGATRCPVIRGRAHCTLPVERGLRLRLSVETFAPAYVWGVDVSPDHVVDLGVVQL
jgi:hypothetical protein